MVSNMSLWFNLIQNKTNDCTLYINQALYGKSNSGWQSRHVLTDWVGLWSVISEALKVLRQYCKGCACARACVRVCVPAVLKRMRKTNVSPGNFCYTHPWVMAGGSLKTWSCMCIGAHHITDKCENLSPGPKNKL